MNLNRRDLLIGVAAASPLAQAQTTDKIPTAVIGTGGRGSYLLSGILQQPDVKAAALCDIKPDRLDKAATAAGRDNPATFSDWRRIIDLKEIQAVFIATPPHLHSEMAVAALKAGKHVYCEKPIGITPAQVRAVVEAAKASKQVFVAGQQLRSMKRYSETVRKIRDGVIGDIVMVKAQRHASEDLPHDGTSGDWYFDVSKSGGYLIEQSVHNLDLCNWAIGAHPSRACGFGSALFYRNDPPGRTIFDCGSLTFEYPGGITMSFTQNVFHPRGLPAGGQYIYVYGSKGAADLMPSATMYPFGKDSTPTVLAEKQQENQHAHIAAFYELIKGNGTNPAGIVVGATAALTAILGHEAMTKQQVVTWASLGVDI